MTDEQKLYELLKKFDPAVGERMEKHFKDGAFYFDLGGSSYPFFEGNTVYTVIPHFAKKRLGRDRKETEAADGEGFERERTGKMAAKKTDRSVIIRATVYLAA